MSDEQIRELLEELDNIKGPAELSDWNIRAQTLLVFEVGRRLCTESRGEE